MKIYIQTDSAAVRLPVLPDSYSLTAKQNHQTVNVVELGELLLKGNRGLNTLSFSSFFPGKKGKHGYSTQGGFKEPYERINRLMRWKDGKTVVRVIITETNINAEFVISDLSYSETGGSGDVEYTISLTEYVRPKVAVRNGKKSALYSASRSTKGTVSESYTVVSGDTLKKIAKKKLGSSSKFTKLAEINHISAPYTVKPGRVIIIESKA